GSSGRMKARVGIANRHAEIIAALFNAQAFWSIGVGLNLIADGPACVAPLEGRHSIPMNASVGISRVRIQRLPNHEDDFGVRHGAGRGSWKADVRGQREIAGCLFPNVVKVVVSGPDVCASSRDIQSPVAWIELSRANPGRRRSADLRLRCKRTEIASATGRY